MTRPELSVVIPTYGGGEGLPELLRRLGDALRDRWTYEVVIVNDASPDATWDVLSELSAAHPELHAIDLLANHGQPVATLCGLAHAQGVLVATMDDDLQHPPEELPVLVDALESNPRWDAVVGSWPRDSSLFRDLGSRVNEGVDRIAHGTPKGFRHSAFRVMRRPVVDALVANQTRSPVLWSLLMQVSTSVYNVDVAHHPRPYGHSGFRFRQGVRLVTTSFFQASTLPLRVLSSVGFASAFLAFLVGGFQLLRWVLGAPIPQGWTSTFLAVTFFGGMSLFGLGLIGEYLALMMREVRQPPRWSVRAHVGAGPVQDDGRAPTAARRP